MALSIHDVERIQKIYPDYQIELREGKIIITGPSDIAPSEIGARFGALLSNWVYSHNAGRVFNARTGLCLPNGDLLSSRVSFVARERLKQSLRTYLPVAPDLVVEIKSSIDRMRFLEEKIALFLSQGVQVGILINPDTHTVSVYRSSGLSEDTESSPAISQKTMLHDADTLTIPELFPGWEMPIASLWPPVYE